MQHQDYTLHQHSASCNIKLSCNMPHLGLYHPQVLPENILHQTVTSPKKITEAVAVPYVLLCQKKMISTSGKPQITY